MWRQRIFHRFLTMTPSLTKVIGLVDWVWPGPQGSWKRVYRPHLLTAQSSSENEMGSDCTTLAADESRYYLFTVDGKQRVSCQRERMSACCVQEGVSGRGDGSEQERTPLIFVNENVIAQGYINDILCPTVQPFQQHGGIYQHDIARPHTTRIVRKCPSSKQRQPIAWPACWTDRSPTEHLGDVMDRRVRQHPHPPAR